MISSNVAVLLAQQLINVDTLILLLRKCLILGYVHMHTCVGKTIPQSIAIKLNISNQLHMWCWKLICYLVRIYFRYFSHNTRVEDQKGLCCVLLLGCHYEGADSEVLLPSPRGSSVWIISWKMVFLMVLLCREAELPPRCNVGLSYRRGDSNYDKC